MSQHNDAVMAFYPHAVSVTNSDVQRNLDAPLIQLTESALRVAQQALEDKPLGDIARAVAALDADTELTTKATFSPAPTAGDWLMILASARVVEAVMTQLYALTPPLSLRDIAAVLWMARDKPAMASSKAETAAKASFSEDEIQAQLDAMEDGCAGGACKL